MPTGGDKIGIVTVAGEIVDGKAGPGTAGGDTIAKAVLDALAKKELKALVVRVDSPGGSALASETIRLAVLEAKKQKLPIVVSMGGLAASGGYWVSTAGDVIFAEPNTITGSIGIFGIIPTFENSLGEARRHRRRGEDHAAVGPARRLWRHQPADRRDPAIVDRAWLSPSSSPASRRRAR